MSLIEIQTTLYAQGMQEQRIPLALVCLPAGDVGRAFAAAETATRLKLLVRLCGASQDRVQRLAMLRGLKVDVVCELLQGGNVELAEQYRELV